MTGRQITSLGAQLNKDAKRSTKHKISLVVERKPMSYQIGDPKFNGTLDLLILFSAVQVWEKEVNSNFISEIL